MKDIQNQTDNRKVSINKVGVKDVKYPIIVLDKKNKAQHTIGTINMYVNLPHNFRGTHMSRFIEILNKYHNRLHIDTMSDILREMETRLTAEEAHMEMTFPYFIEKEAPVSHIKSLMEYECTYTGILKGAAEEYIIKVKVPVTSVCPCSKEISEYGAHNQRSHVTIEVKMKNFIWFEDLIEIAENAASSPVYAILKRVDEKFVTEKGYDNPMFVEDIVRNIAVEMNKLESIEWYHIESENFESIHNHSAYACIDSRDE
ncbi:MAG: GTP cyclohydrolase I FolE2 [Candidatus Marinimicrobia bacterium]|nr:GTP cyclohydrolase I FolE2 [Candidatus Neomarinimicrobiota bacterium]